jgi:hypothetical protein
MLFARSVLLLLLVQWAWWCGGRAEAGAEISGELRQWHKVTLTVEGPKARETDSAPNPFVDYRMTVTFAHESGTPSYAVPGYFAADGNAAETSASEGNRWRAHVSPDKAGQWTYRVSFVKGDKVALEEDAAAEPVAIADGLSGQFRVEATDKVGRDFRAKGRLQYAGIHHLRFAGTGEYFLKAGADSPETLLAYQDFDGTQTLKVPLKTWQPHIKDWRDGDPTWQSGKGKGLIGALNYLAGKGCNACSFMPYNGGGDGQNVWPFVAAADKFHYDCSKLDQWQLVLDHAQARGLYLHFKLQEQENDDNRVGHNDGGPGEVSAALDGGDLGIERKLYVRELVARFAYELALNWNLGEENTQTPEQQRAMARYIRDLDPYDHHLVVHTFPDWQERVYSALLGEQSVLTGASLQNAWNHTHERTVRWVEASAETGRPWVVANDEQGPADRGVPPDPGYDGFNGKTAEGDDVGHDMHDIRRYTLWGNLMAGGAGVEYYFGYQLPQNDLICEDFRSRDQSWDACRVALEFMHEHEIPFWEMRNADALVGNPQHENQNYCLAKQGAVYLVYLTGGGTATLDLSGETGRFSVSWFDPRSGGGVITGSVREVSGGGSAALGPPPAQPDQDWLVVIRR